VFRHRREVPPLSVPLALWAYWVVKAMVRDNDQNTSDSRLNQFCIDTISFAQSPSQMPGVRVSTERFPSVSGR